DSAATAQRYADACLFPPEGWRSWGGGRGTEFNDDTYLKSKWGSKLAFCSWANSQIIISAQIESLEAYEQLAAILAVKTLNTTALGPSDLSGQFGHFLDVNTPDETRINADILDRARKAGKRLGPETMVLMGFKESVLAAGRAFVAQHRDEKIG